MRIWDDSNTTTGGLPKMAILVEIADESRFVLTGYINHKFPLQKNKSRSLLLQPIVVVIKAQLEYDTDLDLYNAILENCELTFPKRKEAKAYSTAESITKRILFRLAVSGHPA
jgi:hypothetical protein